MAAEFPQHMILRVVERAGWARKLKLNARPASVDALIHILKAQLEIDLDFSLRYEDPDFDGKLTSLIDIEELPQKAVVHISLAQDSSSLSSDDTLSREDPSSLEHLRQTIVEVVKKTEMDLPLIKKMMQTTFALRRQTIVRTCPPVNELMDLWPALKMESEVYAEFQRITNQNLPNTFYAAFDRHLPRLMAIFRQKASKTGKTAEALAEIFKIHDEQELHDINTRHVLEESEPELGGVAVALLTVISDNGTSQVQYQPVTISVVIENDIVVSLPRLADAFLTLKNDLMMHV
ncbi:Sterile alpha motif domain containing protein 3 [Dissostichus eleginoides]|uniref:Sterile alpha motif domain containing protein 3 n=1 Tax=Dissostichus eleginoides TaxID=100907 RepID=A0AAD9FE54_DISEL|nr:Sterile alpha motif domain containing protein 3 [Dissostichus eleginoides]